MPLKGEQDIYYERGRDGTCDEQYGVVAFVPKSRPHRNVLILEGTNSPGTQAAWEFVADPALTTRFLQMIGAANREIRCGTSRSLLGTGLAGRFQQWTGTRRRHFKVAWGKEELEALLDVSGDVVGACRAPGPYSMSLGGG